MTSNSAAEAIVRQLAAIDDPTVMDRDYAPSAECGLCGVGDESYTHRIDDPTLHEPDCAWRLARDWVAAQPA